MLTLAEACTQDAADVATSQALLAQVCAGSTTAACASRPSLLAPRS